MFDDFISEAEKQDLMEYIQANERDMIDNLVREYKADGKTQREIAILLFTHEHESDIIFEAQTDQLEYLWDGGLLH